MGNPYLADFLNADGSVRFGGEVTFTDPGNQPGGGGSQPISSPLDIPGCVLLLDASSIEGLNDGDPVELWPDTSGNGYDATPVGTHAEQYVLAGTTPGEGTVKGTFRGDTTAAVNFDATAEEWAAALELLPSIGAGNIRATPGHESDTLLVFGKWLFQFIGDFGYEEVENITLTDDTTDGNLTVGYQEVGASFPPTYVADARNGLPAVAFDGSQAMELLTALGIMRNKPGATLIVTGEAQALFSNYDPLYISSETDINAVRFGMNDGQTYVDPADTEIGRAHV